MQGCEGCYAGIFRPGEDRVREYRLRRDQPDLEYDSAGNLKLRQRYLSPPGRSNMLYLSRILAYHSCMTSALRS